MYCYFAVNLKLALNCLLLFSIKCSHYELSTYAYLHCMGFTKGYCNHSIPFCFDVIPKLVNFRFPQLRKAAETCHNSRRFYFQCTGCTAIATTVQI